MRAVTRAASIAVLLMAIAACSDGSSGSSTTATTGPGTTTTLPPGVTGTLPPEPTVTTLAVPELNEPQVVFFFAPGADGQPRLAPVWRDATSPQGIEGALELLMSGPTTEERGLGITSEIPIGSRLLGVEVTEDTAVIDVSSEFETGGGTASVRGRLAQLVYTATRFPEVSGIALRVDGSPIRVLSSEGVLVEPPVKRDAVVDVLGAIFVESPATNGELGQPGVLEGSTTLTDLRLELRNEDGALIAQQVIPLQSTLLGRQSFSATVPYGVELDQPGTLTLIGSAEDAQLALAVPVQLSLPTGALCSAAGLPPELEDQDLPDAVAATRDAIVMAAVECDFAALAALATHPDFTYSFAEFGEPAAFWEAEEAQGVPLMRQLTQLLGTPPVFLDEEFVTPTYLWPAAFASFPLGPGELDPLRGILPDEELDLYEEFGEYLGLRIGIEADGTWAFMVSGD